MSQQNPTDKGEFALIRQIRNDLDAFDTPSHVPFGDDMAAMDRNDPQLLGTTDMIMDGVDFKSGQHRWYDVGWKAMAINLSDCAAMAAVPMSALVASSLNNQLSMDDAMELLRGMRDCGRQYNCPLVGGDTNSWDQPTAVAITIIARPEPGQSPVRRDGAQVGDRIFVTGPLGGSILGRHLRPQPRIETALTISRELSPHAMIDISDGLAIDLNHILEESHCGAALDEFSLLQIIHPDAEKLSTGTGHSALDHALHDGEDFELIVVLPENVNLQRCRELGMVEVGIIAEGDKLVLSYAGGKTEPIEPRGWEHFQ